MIDPTVSTAWAQFEVQAISTLGPALITAALAAIGYAGVLVRRKWNVDAKVQASNVVETTIDNGANLSIANAAEKLAAGVAIPSLRDFVTDGAQDYAAPKIMAELKTLGIDPHTLPERIDARVAGKLMDPVVQQHLTDAIAQAGVIMTRGSRAAPPPAPADETFSRSGA